jgi:hypothetical protein
LDLTCPCLSAGFCILNSKEKQAEQKFKMQKAYKNTTAFQFAIRKR